MISSSTTVPARSGGRFPRHEDTDLKAQLQKASIPPAQADAVLKANSDARLSALHTSLSVVALVAVAAMFFMGLIPVRPVGQPGSRAAALT